MSAVAVRLGRPRDQGQLALSIARARKAAVAAAVRGDRAEAAEHRRVAEQLAQLLAPPAD